jgi:hypothetical protein
MCSELQFALFRDALPLDLKYCDSDSCPPLSRWLNSCNSQGACTWGDLSGEQVTTLFGTPEVQPRSKHTLLPILTVLFLISYGLMTLLIVEQGSTIQSQRTLIRQLLGDSTELSAMKGKAIQQQAHTLKPEVDAQASAPVQTPSTQAVPSEKTTAKNRGGKAQRPMPEKPPVPASDIADARRTLMSI